MFLYYVQKSYDLNVKGDRWIYTTIILSLIFFLIFSYYSVLRYISLNATGFDLGIYSSALYNAVHGGLFYTNLLNESYLGNHFSPFMFFLLPFYYIYQHNSTLLIIQAFSISFGAVPLYLAFRRICPETGYSIYGIFIVLVYELSPIAIGPISFDFHLMALMPFFYLSAFYFFLSRRMIPFYISIGAIVSIHAFFAIIAIFFIFSLYLARYVRRGCTKDMKNGIGKTIVVLSGFIVTAAILMAYLIFAEHMKSSISGSSFSITGINSLILYLKNQYNISFTLKMFLSAYRTKFGLLLIAVLGGGFLAVFYPIALIPIIPYLMFSMFSGNSAYYIAGYQYTAMFSPMIFAASVYGIKKVAVRLKGLRLPKHGVKTAIVIFVLIISVLNFALSPISPEPVHIESSNITGISQFHVNQTSEALFLLRDNINRSSTVLTQNNLYPQFSKFTDAYLLYSYNAIGNLSSMIYKNFTYIIADRYSPFYEQNDLVGISMKGLVQKLSLSDYGYYFNEFGIVVLKYAYSGPEYVMVNGTLVPS